MVVGISRDGLFKEEDKAGTVVCTCLQLCIRLQIVAARARTRQVGPKILYVIPICKAISSTGYGNIRQRTALVWSPSTAFANCTSTFFERSLPGFEARRARTTHIHEQQDPQSMLQADSQKSLQRASHGGIIAHDMSDSGVFSLEALESDQ